jgi:hypothetical protein
MELVEISGYFLGCNGGERTIRTHVMLVSEQRPPRGDESPSSDSSLMLGKISPDTRKSRLMILFPRQRAGEAYERPAIAE